MEKRYHRKTMAYLYFKSLWDLYSFTRAKNRRKFSTCCERDSSTIKPASNLLLAFPAIAEGDSISELIGRNDGAPAGSSPRMFLHQHLTVTRSQFIRQKLGIILLSPLCTNVYQLRLESIDNIYSFVTGTEKEKTTPCLKYLHSYLFF